MEKWGLKMVMQCKQLVSLLCFINIHATHFSNQSSDLYPLLIPTIYYPLYIPTKNYLYFTIPPPHTLCPSCLSTQRKSRQVLRLYQDKNRTHAVGSNSLITAAVCGCIEEGQPEFGPDFSNLILAWSKVTHSDFLLAGSLRECPHARQPSENQAWVLATLMHFLSWLRMRHM